MRRNVVLSATIFLSLGACAAPDSDRDNDSGIELAAASAPIIGGELDPNHHDYVVGIGDDGEAWCTATVISRRTVLTAAHCVVSYDGGDGAPTRVTFGSELQGPQQPVAVLQAVAHPSYDGESPDVALLQLAEDAPVQPAPLLRDTMSNDTRFIGPDFTFVGYGNDDGVNQTGFGMRRVAHFPIALVGPGPIPAGEYQGEPLYDTEFYYAVPGKNTCNGDSGGPAFFVDQGVETVAGVTSWGDGPCTVMGVNARTDLPMIQQFIQPTIDSFEAGLSCSADGQCDASCQTGGELVDPDCASMHCGHDGVCAQACSAPVDPDCNGIAPPPPPTDPTPTPDPAEPNDPPTFDPPDDEDDAPASTPKPSQRSSASEDDEGCSVSAPAGGSSSTPALWALALAAAGLGRRSRSRRQARRSR
jgi:MYXO-CTERM domain-containing protein